MKLSKEVLLEVVAIFQEGLLQQKDISENFRRLDLVELDGELVLSEDYKNAKI